MLDPISVMMLVVVSFISLMVHCFSIGYMKGEERFSTYFSFLQLFTFSMLGLVIASNIFMIYMFWELVGLSSYLLIGFYYTRSSAVAAAKKAFIVTRFADLGFLIGVLILSYYAGSLDFETVIARLSDKGSAGFIGATTGTFIGISFLTWALTLIFIGGAGKSAMFPLHIWLPDAMEGPTPVSALIHAATMVVAGVFLVARLFPLFHLNYVSLQIVTVVGLFSALLAAIIACTQTDIKRILAYSTMSQIGFMMFALGVAGSQGDDGLGYTASMFHLFTHAFFKSLLFLCAGAVIHVVHSNNMYDMGGLRKAMPITHISFLIACLAISGIPPFAGFFSKEEILLAAWQSNKIVFYVAIITSCLTAFYMFRLYFSIFWQKDPVTMHRHEGSISMKVPLIILSVCTITAGFIPFAKFISADKIPHESEMHFGFSVAPVLLSLAGIITAYIFYKKQNPMPAKFSTSMGGLYRGAFNKFYIDEIYVFITKKIIFNLIGRPAAWIDKNIVDRFIVGTGTGTEKISEKIKGIQSGKVQDYALYFFAGIAGFAILLLYWKYRI
jgi:NADH-quinone oxidoreductase subunit L